MKCDLEIEAFREMATKRFEQIGGLAACVGVGRFTSSYVISTLDGDHVPFGGVTRGDS